MVSPWSALTKIFAIGWIAFFMAISPKVSAAGTVIAWGDNRSGQTNVPSGLDDVIAVAAGDSHSLALREDGRVVAWGDNTYGQTNVPPGLSNVVAIAGGFRHSVALRNDGTVTAWGNNSSGQTNVPANLTNVTAIAAGRNFSAALRRDSTIVVWGETIHVGWPDIVSIAAGNFIVALRNDGTVIAQRSFSYPVPASATNTIAVSAAADSSFGGRAIALQADGTVIGWQLPQGPTNAPSNVSNAVGIAAGPIRSAILTEDGQVLEWYYSQAAVATPYSNVCAIAAGSAHFLAIQTTLPCLTLQPHSQTAFVGKRVTLHARAAGAPQLYQWYYNSNLLAGATNASLSITSAQITNSGAYVCVISNTTGAVTTSVARVTVVPVAGWGNNINGQAQIFPELSNVVAVAAGESHSLGIRADGTVIGWGDNSSGKATPPPGLQNVIAIAAGGTHSLALKQDGTVTAWGANDVGQTNVPASATNIIAIAAGTAHSLALRANGSVIGWGDGRFGLTNVPSGVGDVVQIAASGMQNIILRENGTHQAWGQRVFAQFAPFEATNLVSVAAAPSYYLVLRADGRVFGWSAAPLGVQVPSTLSNVVAISAGGHSEGAVGYALRSDGTIVSWERGSPGLATIPAGLSNVTSVSSVARHVLATIGDGSPHITIHPRDRTTHIGGETTLTVMAVGRDDLQYVWLFNGTVIPNGTNRTLRLQDVQRSQRGTYTVIVSNSLGSASASAELAVVPVVVGGFFAEANTVPPDLEDVVGIAVGDNHSLALLRNGSVRGWGLNAHGQATPPPGLTNIVAVAAGGAHSLALASDGAVIGWGDNSAGQTTAPAGLNDFIAIDARNRYSLGLRRNGTVVAWGDGAQGQTNIPTALTNVTAIAAGEFHAAALLASGRVVVWGASEHGQFNIPVGLEPAVFLTGGRFHTAAITMSGSATGWGYGDGRQTVAPPSLGKFKAIFGHSTYTIGITELGTLASWESAIGVPRNLQNVVAVAAKNNHFLALIADGPSVARLVGGDRTVYRGDPVILGSSVVGGPGLTFQWQRNGIDIPGATNATLVLPTATASDVGSYRLVVSNSAGTAISTEVMVAVADSPPKIITHPFDQWSYPGGTVRLRPVVDGSAPLDYQWRFAGTNLIGATNLWLDIDPLTVERTGDYSLVVHNPYGSATSQVARVSMIQIAGWGANSLGQAAVPRFATNVTRIAAGTSHSLALKQDGTVFAWGDNGLGQASVPVQATNISALAGGRFHSLALTHDGNVVAWGDNTYGQSTVPSGLSNVVSIAAGEDHSLAVRADGVVFAWGASGLGATNVPVSATNVVSVASGRLHSVALISDGTVRAWGSSFGGRTNVPANLSNVVAVAAGDDHSLALRADGTVVAWGDSFGGVTNVPPDLTNVVSIAVGRNFALAARSDGTISVWGSGAPGVPQNLDDVSQVAAGPSHALALINKTLQTFKIEPAPPGGASFALRAATERGRVYRLEYKDSLADPQWIGLALVAGDGRVQTFTDPSPAPGQRFYRLGRW